MLLREVVTVVSGMSSLIWARHIQMCCDIPEGLSCLLNVIHRDIKSDNIVLDESPTKTPSDFPRCSTLFLIWPRHAGDVRLIMHYSTANNQETPYEPLAPLYGASSATQYPQDSSYPRECAPAY
uniref:Protein kinase domain-containing protein n=1 Tax=Tanacetum cinerariifolium TaxID=118510 RepID=A0A6L2MIY7_TANCI|nr:hypothetical protein [Tanacetum cinerariifolium]